MKARVLFWLAVPLIFGAMLALAANVDGKWTAQVPSRDGGTRDVTFNFKAEGETLTGTMSSPMGDREISEGKVAGDDISFTITVGNGMKILYKGKVSGDEIKFTSEREGGGRTREFTAKRAGS